MISSIPMLDRLILSEQCYLLSTALEKVYNRQPNRPIKLSKRRVMIGRLATSLWNIHSYLFTPYAFCYYGLGLYGHTGD